MATRLEAGGYAYREIDPTDRRRILMHASPTGTQRAFSLFDDFYQASAGLFGSYGERDQKLLLEILARFRQVLTDQAAATERADAAERPAGYAPGSRLQHHHGRLGRSQGGVGVQIRLKVTPPGPTGEAARLPPRRGPAPGATRRRGRPWRRDAPGG